jgi:nitrate reductase NapD
MVDELHIASVVVQCTPRKLAPLMRDLVSLPGAVVHATSTEGKAVITLEAASGDAITATVAQIQQLDGVLSAALVYQCVDTLDAMNQEMP